MAQLLQGDEWTVRGWARAALQLDEELWREPQTVALLEEVRIVAALLALAVVAMLVV